MPRTGYARVSTADQHPDEQEHRLREAGCERVFTDYASGAKASRPEWDKLLAILQPGDTLCCTKLDRIGRSARNLLDVVERLSRDGIGLHAIDQGIDTTNGNNPIGGLLIAVLAAIAEFERALIIERTLDGQAAVRRAGNLRRSLGGLPVLGYADTGGDDWAVDPAAAALLREVAAKMLAGVPLTRAFAETAAVQPETVRIAQGAPVTAKHVRAALQRPATAGLIRDRDGMLLGPVLDDPPLDETTWRTVTAIFDGRKQGQRARDDHRYPFGELLRCARCGNQLSGSPLHKIPYYRCKNPHKGLGVARPCHGVSIRAADVHAVLRAAMQGWMRGSALYREAAARAAAETGQFAAERDRLSAALALRWEWQSDLDDKRLMGMPADRYARTNAELMRQITGLQAELDALAATEARVAALPADRDRGWDVMTPGERRTLIKLALVTPILVQPGKGGPNAPGAETRIALEVRR
jgi:DNA invertase Pin-like site-specific DNA recombinase